MKLFKKLFSSVSFFALLLSLAFFQKQLSKFAVAQGGGSGGADSELNIYDLKSLTFPTKGAIDLKGDLNLGEIISEGLKVVYVLAGIILLVYLIMAGFQMMTGANDPKAKESAGKSITNAVIGFFILFVSYWVIQIVEVVLGISILK